jgi:hypothetical protein
LTRRLPDNYHRFSNERSKTDLFARQSPFVADARESPVGVRRATAFMWSRYLNDQLRDITGSLQALAA